MSWARMLKRVFAIDIERCACGGKLKFVAVIEQPGVIEKILTHLGLSPQPLLMHVEETNASGFYRRRRGGSHSVQGRGAMSRENCGVQRVASRFLRAAVGRRVKLRAVDRPVPREIPWWHVKNGV